MRVQNESEGFEESENSFCFLIRLIMVTEVIDGIPPVAFLFCFKKCMYQVSGKRKVLYFKRWIHDTMSSKQYAGQELGILMLLRYSRL